MRKHKPSVLIVDDEEGIRHLIYDIFLLSGDYYLKMVPDGYKAVEEIKKKEYDVITLDLKMPGMDGIEVLKIIKKEYEDIPVIIISGYSEYEGLKEVLTSYNNVFFLQKPFRAFDLLSLAKEIMVNRKVKDG